MMPVAGFKLQGSYYVTYCFLPIVFLSILFLFTTVILITDY